VAGVGCVPRGVLRGCLKKWKKRGDCEVNDRGRGGGGGGGGGRVGGGGRRVKRG